MFRLYSKGCEYAIRALVHAAPVGRDELFQTKTVCKQAGIPESFTRKIFQSLVQGGFLRGSRGPGGGYMLTKDPTDITLLEIIEAVDSRETFAGCIMGLPVCDTEQPCPLHHVWSVAKDDLLSQLESQTLQDVIDTTEQRRNENEQKIKRPKRRRLQR